MSIRCARSCVAFNVPTYRWFCLCAAVRGIESRCLCSHVSEWSGLCATQQQIVPGVHMYLDIHIVCNVLDALFTIGVLFSLKDGDLVEGTVAYMPWPDRS